MTDDAEIIASAPGFSQERFDVESTCEFPRCEESSTYAQVAAKSYRNNPISWYIYFFCDPHSDIVLDNSGIVELE